MSDIAIDVSISYAINKNPAEVTEVLTGTSMDLFTWFQNNGMKTNVEKSRPIVTSKDKVFAKNRLYDIQ